MDLHLTAAAATDEERAAVDDLLGAPASGWHGAGRDEVTHRVARGGRAARDERHLLLPALHALQARVGWISEGGLNYVCERLTIPPAEAYGVATFYAMFSVEPRATTVVHVCDDLACRVGGAEAICAHLEARVRPGRGGCGGRGRRHLGAEPVPGPVRARARDPVPAGGRGCGGHGLRARLRGAGRRGGPRRAAGSAGSGTRDRRPRSAPAATRRRRRPGLLRRLPRARGVSGAPARGRARRRGDDRARSPTRS